MNIFWFIMAFLYSVILIRIFSVIVFSPLEVTPISPAWLVKILIFLAFLQCGFISFKRAFKSGD